MENWLIGTRMAILIYCVMRYIQGGMEKIPLVVLLILAYICTVMIAEIFKKLWLGRCLLLASILVLAVSASIANQLFILLIVVDILELVSGFTEDHRLWLAFTAVPVLFVWDRLLPEYILTGLLSLLVFLLVSKLSTSSSTLKSANEKLKNRNEELSSRIDAGNEYESQIRYLSQLEERNSLAQKIHDKVGHTIAGSIIQLEAASMIIEKDRDKAAGIIAAVTDNLKDGMESIRSTLRSIKPAPEQLGVNRLKLILEEFSMNHAIKTTLSYTGSLDAITHFQWKIIMDNIKEALTNALKYSSATKIIVKLEVMTRLIKAEVKDNGNGTLSIKKGMGLTGMEERAENAGGKLILDGSSGFSVITILPIGEVNNDH
jgi:signal transduction histidine kinase